MEQQSNNALRLRRMAEDLSIMAEEYDETGQLEERDQINEAEEAIRGLFSLPDVEDEYELAEDCG